MKKIILYAACILIVSSVAAAPGTKLVEKFKSTFPNAKSVKWSDDKEGYFVSFYEDENFEKVLYNKDGDFICSWKYSQGTHLPTNIIMTLNKKFGGSKIVGATELTQQNNTTYEIKIEKGDKLYNLDMLADGSIIKEQKFINQNTTGYSE